ncbi:UNVERIFIED_CONTAM: hypothetical protein FKN15_065286 [Acipenser sinensis]
MSPLIETVSDHKDFKKLLRTRTNVLILYSKSAAAGERQLKLLSDVAQAVKGQGTIAWVDCGDSEGRKLCKKTKVDPSSKRSGVELLHYKDGIFHTEYNRPETYKVLAGMNVHPSEFDGIKQEFNVKGYPTFCYFEKGKFLHHYESYGATAKDIVEWMKNPQPPQPQAPEVVWSEQGSAVFHLTDDNFHQFLQDHPSVLLMFYAPWCGHCKKMKPEYDKAAEILNKNQDSPGVLAAVDSTIHKAVGERYHITGFPTVKYFENGEEKYTLPHLRSKDKIIEWLHNPQAPPPPEQSWEEKPSSVSHLGVQDFRESLKKKKHALVMFYAPCKHIAYAAVDCTKGQNNELCKQESVEGYPTFNYYNYGKFIEKYSGDRGESGFIGFMKTLRGKDQEKVGKWKEELLPVILLKMSMVLFASVVRVRDGLPLSASTDYEQDRGVQESKKYLKTLSKKLSQLPDRCTLKTGQYNIKLPVILLKMSMVLFASVVRVRDGLPLSASTDYEQDRGVQESKKYLKTLSKKLSQLPDRCTLKTGQYNINFTSSLGVGYMMVCMESYPSVLAFSFLDELQREFIVSSDTKRISSAVRPYSFIEFAPNQMLEPVTLAGIVSCVLSLLCGSLNLIRGVHAIESILQNEDEDCNYVIAFFLGMAACFYQCYLFAFCTSWRNMKSCLSFGLICLCSMYLYELRNMWQLLFHVTVGAFTTLQIRLRQPQGKAPDYNV